MLGGYALGKPVRSALGGKSEAAKSGWQNPYVSDGLVAMWDGIENAGWGVHDGSIQVWKDLVGGFDLTIGTASSWETNSLYVAQAVPKGAAFREEVFDRLTVKTIEVCFQVETGPSQAWIICINGSVSSGGTALCMILRTSAGEGIMRNATVSTPWQRDNKANTIAVMADRGFVNAVDLGTRAYPNTFNNPDCFCLFGRNGSTTYQPSTGRIYRCAIYNRPLTANEIQANYQVDKRRFGL